MPGEANGETWKGFPMAFSYPEDLIPRLRKVWRERRAERKHAPGLPTRDRLEHFLEVAFHASFLTEEQRNIQFRLALVSKRAAEREAGLAGVHRKFELVEFAVPRGFSVTEILRLAPATDVTRTLICVQAAPARAKRSGEPFEIWGFLHTGSSWWEFTHGECQIGVPPPNCLAVSSGEPGTLTVSHEGDVLLRLKHGEIVTPSGHVLYRGPIAEFLRTAQDDIYSATCRQIGAREFDPAGHDNHYPMHLYNSYIERLLFHIRETHHGGILLIVPDHLDAGSPELASRLLVKYPSTYDSTWSLLVSSLALRRKYFDLYLPLWNRKSPIPVARYQELSVVETERDEIGRRISDSVTLIASTSGVDGASLLTTKLRLIGFGAEVITAFPELKEVQLAKGPTGKTTTRVPIDAFGTRHRSAFRFCSSFEDSVAFVISQDGGVKGVKRVGNRLIVWPDITFGPLGI